MQIIRHRNVALHNMKVTLHAVCAHFTYNLKLRNDLVDYARWSEAFPLQLQHDIEDEASPLHPSRGLVDRLMIIRVSIDATDNTGGHVLP